MARRAAEPGLIRRYENRKLYEPAARRYVQLEGLAGRIAAGEELRFVDQKSGEDITTLLLAHMVLELIRQRAVRIPNEVLARLIRLGSDGSVPAPAPRDAAAHARDEAERIVSELVKRGRLSLEEALALRQDIGTSLHRVLSDAQKSIEGRVHGLVESTLREAGVSPALAALRRRLLEFEAYLPAPVRPRSKHARPAAGERKPKGPARKGVKRSRKTTSMQTARVRRKS